jgi:hypothetical protein
MAILARSSIHPRDCVVLKGAADDADKKATKNTKDAKNAKRQRRDEIRVEVPGGAA